MSIGRLPYEIVSCIVGYLDLDDFYNLATTCRSLRYLVQDDSTCRVVLQATTSSSVLEVQSALRNGGYARALRRLVMRRRAVSSASPFLAATVAVTDSWVYENGVLCYVRGHELRILHLHDSADHEVVVDIGKLLTVTGGGLSDPRKYSFTPLYCAAQIVSCLYSEEGPRGFSWLVIFNAVEKHILSARRLRSSCKIFVRNTDRYLYYGTYSDFGADGFRRWAFRGFDISRRQWLTDTFHVANIMGSEIGSTACFEIIDGYFYGVSNETSFVTEELDWTSYYCYFRFPLDKPSIRNAEWPSKRRLWRRQHAEGPIDDRWTSLKLFQDEASGRLSIVESRKEWLSGQGSSTRTYYTTRLDFGYGEDVDAADGDCHSTGYLYPVNHQLAKVFGKEQHPNYMPAPKRSPHAVHLGDDSSALIMFTLGDSLIRSYHPAVHTFLDVVNDPHPLQPSLQRVRIRAGSRRLRPEPERSARRMSAKGRYGESYTLMRELDDVYESKEVVYWPRERIVAAGRTAADSLQRVLNPPGFSGQFGGAWDERALVYATGSIRGDGQKALVLVSFDPAIRLRGLPLYGGGASGPSDAQAVPRGAHQMHTRAAPAGEWASEEPALYRSINRGYYLPRDE